MDIKFKICNGKCPIFSWTMFYVLLSHGNAVLPNWTLKGSLCSNCTTPLWVGFIIPRCYICQFDQNIVWYIMQLSFCFKLRSRGWRTLQCWYWRWGNSCRASQLVVNRTSTTTSPVHLAFWIFFYHFRDFWLVDRNFMYLRNAARANAHLLWHSPSFWSKGGGWTFLTSISTKHSQFWAGWLHSISGQIRQKRDSLKVL